MRGVVTVHDSGVGDDVRIYEGVSVDESDTAGPADVDVNANADVENARLEPTVQVGRTPPSSGSHESTDEWTSYREDRFEAVVLERGAFVGAAAVVLPGVTVGENAVVGAGGTVDGDVPPGTLL